MCGIHAVFSAHAPGQISENLKTCLCSRGPDHFSTYETRLSTGSSDELAIHLSFTSTVLALRGDHVARQPFIETESGSVFCWNGEAWKVRQHDVAGNDGKAIASMLADAVRGGGGVHDREHRILGVLRAIEGPFAFVFFDKSSKRVYFGRDRLGRRSLLIKGDKQLVLSSVADTSSTTWREVEADGIYVLDLGQLKAGGEDHDLFTSISKREWLEGEAAANYVSSRL